MRDAKQDFLREFGDDYGYPNAPKGIDEIRASEFKRLEGLVYLDHAGATLYSEAQMEAVVKDLTSNVYANPHSQSDYSLATSEMIRAARQQVLDFCNASPDEYKCIFTSGATAALKLVGEAFPWSRESCFMYTLENHNSVLGIREYALEKGARAIAVNIEEVEQQVELSGALMLSIDALPLSEMRRTGINSSTESMNGNVYSLFAFPSECNFSGMKYPLELVNSFKRDACKLPKDLTNNHDPRGSWMVLIDAAKGCATQQLDLMKFPADFAVLSFYKIFGYPTGLGALVVRNDAAKLLKKAYFSGGTVSAAIADADYVKRRDSIEQLFEDGTLSFLSIASTHHGFKIINILKMSAISRHTQSLATYVKKILLNLKHENGVSISEVYGHKSESATLFSWGATIAFNLRRPDGSWFGYREVEKLGSLYGIQLRTGCFCNPGACAKYLQLSHSEVLSNIEAGHVCWDDHDVLNGKPTGAVRVSFGYMSTFEDAEKFLGFIEESFVSKAIPCNAIKNLTLSGSTNPLSGPFLTSITVYPIKSCAGFNVDSWPLCRSGLLYDREWLLKSPDGEILTQKKVPQMSSIYVSINLSKHQLYVESPNCRDKLQITLQHSLIGKSNEEIDLHGERFEVEVYNSDVNLWFTNAIGRPCTLARNSGISYQKCSKRNGVICRDKNGKLSFVNEAQLLLISEDSVIDLNHRLKSGSPNSKCQPGKSVFVDSSRFRPNLVVSGAEPYAEDNWRTMFIGQAKFTSLGGCNRCQMINLDSCNGQIKRSREPLATLASFRRVQGKILFGILLRYKESAADDWNEGEDSAQTWLTVGQQVLPEV